MATWHLFVLYNNETNYYSFFISKSFSINRKPAFAHFGKNKKSQKRNPQSLICARKSKNKNTKLTS